MSKREDKKVQALCQAILKTAVDSIHSEFNSLPVQLKTIAEEKIATFETEMTKLIDESTKEREKACTSAVSQSTFKGKQELIKVLDSVVGNILTAAYEKAVKKYEESPGGAFIRALAIEGVHALPGNSFQVAVTQASKDALGHRFLEDLENHFSTSDRQVSLSYASDPLKDGGVQIITKNGRAFYDNTIKDRFRRNRKALFASVKEMVKNEAEKEGYKG